MMKILIADDHAIVRKGLIQIARESDIVTDIDEAGNAAEVFQKVNLNKYDVIVLDISMPGKDGIEVLRELKQRDDKIKVLMLSTYSVSQYALRALKAGASGYLRKTEAPDELVKAILKIYRGSKYISEEVAEELAAKFDEDPDKPLHENLSDREFQVLKLIASGNNLSQIADNLFLSKKTISTYRARILEKMNMKSNAELTHYAIKNELVE
ncbi:response regulator [Bacteroidota bacterium]